MSLQSLLNTTVTIAAAGTLRDAVGGEVPEPAAAVSYQARVLSSRGRSHDEMGRRSSVVEYEVVLAADPKAQIGDVVTLQDGTGLKVLAQIDGGGAHRCYYLQCERILPA